MTLIDKYGRTVNYLRISVTDRCNLRCSYCMPPGNIETIPQSEILSYEEIYEFVKIAVTMGIDRVKITGGEPLVRKDVSKLIELLSSINGIKDLAMVTNGTLLSKFADELVHAGLKRINISFDTLDPQKYSRITGGGNIDDVISGIFSAKKCGLSPIKINCVIEKSPDEKDAIEVAKFAKENNLEVRFIRKMNLREGNFWEVEHGKGGKCIECNRLRLMCNGELVPCLFSDIRLNIKRLSYADAIKQAIFSKPLRGKRSFMNQFYSIGG